MANYEVIQIDENTWRIENMHVRFFLLTGTKKALLIDSGMNVENVKEIVAGITNLPLELINTHADIDHIGANEEFDSFMMSPAECSNYFNTKNKSGNFIPVYEGDIIDLGDRELEIVLLSGHTPGSIGILDKGKRVIFTGDPIQDGQIYMFGVQREMHAYLCSLKHLDKYRGKFDLIYPSHGSIPVKPEIIDKLYEAGKRILAGECTGKEEELFGNKIRRVDMGVATFLIER